MTFGTEPRRRRRQDSSRHVDPEGSDDWLAGYRPSTDGHGEGLQSYRNGESTGQSDLPSQLDSRSRYDSRSPLDGRAPDERAAPDSRQSGDWRNRSDTGSWSSANPGSGFDSAAPGSTTGSWSRPDPGSTTGSWSRPDPGTSTGSWSRSERTRRGEPAGSPDGGSTWSQSPGSAAVPGSRAFGGEPGRGTRSADSSRDRPDREFTAADVFGSGPRPSDLLSDNPRPTDLNAGPALQPIITPLPVDPADAQSGPPPELTPIFPTIGSGRPSTARRLTPTSLRSQAMPRFEPPRAPEAFVPERPALAPPEPDWRQNDRRAEPEPPWDQQPVRDLPPVREQQMPVRELPTEREEPPPWEQQPRWEQDEDEQPRRRSRGNTGALRAVPEVDAEPPWNGSGRAAPEAPPWTEQPDDGEWQEVPGPAAAAAWPDGADSGWEGPAPAGRAAVLDRDEPFEGRAAAYADPRRPLDDLPAGRVRSRGIALGGDLDPMPGGRGFALRSRLPRNIVTTWSVIGALVLVAACVVGAVFMFNEEQNGPPGASRNSSTQVPRQRDISSQAVDPAALTEQEVYPRTELSPVAEEPPYQVLKVQASSDCRSAVTDDLGKLLQDLGCTQVVRATIRHPSQNYLITAGLFNLRDEAAANEARVGIKPSVDSEKGRFSGMIAGEGTDAIVRASTQLGWNVRGHFLAYCVIARADGQPLGGNDDQFPRQITFDIVETHLLDGVVGARVVPEQAAPTS